MDGREKTQPAPWRHAFTGLNPRMREGLTVHGRRSVLKAGLAGMAGLSLPDLLKAQTAAVKNGVAMPSNKSVILLWMTGGPSHIDTWDPKPDAPRGIRGPFDTISTKIPGVHICEHLPRQAAMLDKLTEVGPMYAALARGLKGFMRPGGSWRISPTYGKKK